MDGEILHERRVPPSEMLGILGGDTREGWMDGSVHGLTFPCFFPFFLSFIRIRWARKPGAPWNILPLRLAMRDEGTAPNRRYTRGVGYDTNGAERLCHDLYSVIRTGGDRWSGRVGGKLSWWLCWTRFHVYTRIMSNKANSFEGDAFGSLMFMNVQCL